MKPISKCIFLFILTIFATLQQTIIIIKCQHQPNGTAAGTNLIIIGQNHSTHDSSNVQSILYSLNDLLSRLLNQPMINQARINQSQYQAPIINLLNLTVIINNYNQANQFEKQQKMNDSSEHHVNVDKYNPVFPPLSHIPVNHSDPVSEDRRNFIVNMTKDAWNAYTQHAWGQIVLRPMSLNEKYPLPKTGETIVAASSTLWLMGLTTEFQRAKQWIKQELNVTEIVFRKEESQLSVIDYLGALLSCFALTGDEMFKDKAKEIAYNLIAHANQVDDSEKQMTLQERLVSKANKLSEFINQRVEYRYLRDVANDSVFESQLRQNEELVKSTEGLKSSSIELEDRLMMDVKSYLQQNRTDKEGIRLYNQTIYNFLQDKNSPFQRTEHNLTLYVRNMSDHMNVNDCKFGALFSLGVRAFWQVEDDFEGVSHFLHAGVALRRLRNTLKHENLAEQITETCHLAANGTQIGLPPASFAIENDNVSHVLPKIIGHGSYRLTANLAESYFVLWRSTNNEKYRTYAWELAQAIQRHCRTDVGGYAPITEVNAQETNRIDYQPAHFLAATLKYLYLTFSPVDFVPLREWVFNLGGHLLPVCGGDNAAYAKQCNITKVK